jgi:enoyl-CoA hydratase
MGVRVEVSGGVAVITLANPPVNSVPIEMMQDIIDAFDSINDRDDVIVAVLTGEGKVFSAGADLKKRKNSDEPQLGDAWRRLRLAREVGYCIMECHKPVIAAVNGAALGAGLGLAVCCDILIASETAVFGLPEIDVGLMGGGSHAMRIFPHSLARRMMLTGYRVPAAEMYRRGLIEACLPAEELMPYAMGMAAEIASKSPVAVRYAKNSMNTVEGMTLRDGYRYEQNNTYALGKTEDAKEAVRAFVEKRAPVFTGR